MRLVLYLTSISAHSEVPKIKFLGNVVSVNGIEVVPGKLQP